MAAKPFFRRRKVCPLRFCHGLDSAPYTGSLDRLCGRLMPRSFVGGNLGHALISGLRLEHAWLRLDANVGYLDAEYDEFFADLTGDGIETDNSDLKLRRTPKWTFGISGNYDIPVGPGYLNFYASYRYTDNYWVEVRNDPRGLLDDRGVIDG